MSVDNSRIAKNTVYLYIRMIFVLGANFFAVRSLDITKDVDSERTPRGAMSEDLNAAPFQNLTSFRWGRLTYCFDNVNRLLLYGGDVWVRSNSRPYYDQRVVAKFKADSEASSIQGHMHFGKSAVDAVYDNRFRLILQAAEAYNKV